MRLPICRVMLRRIASTRQCSDDVSSVCDQKVEGSVGISAVVPRLVEAEGSEVTSSRGALSLRVGLSVTARRNW